MSAQELALNIAVNLGRIGRWASEGRLNRLNQFLEETEKYILELEKSPKSSSFQRTFDIFRENFSMLKKNTQIDAVWIETVFTWADILTHRAKLA